MNRGRCYIGIQPPSGRATLASESWGLWMIVRALLSDDGNGQQEISEDESPLSGKLHAKGWKVIGSYWKGRMCPLI
jgi:hypothetical protein